MTESQAYVAFNLTDHVGYATVETLAAEAGSVAAAWESYPKKVSRAGGEVDWEAEFAMAERFNVHIVTPADEGYPQRLKAAPGRPLALYVRGNLEALDKSAIAIVGTRRSTSYGVGVANAFSYDLARAGWSIVSGLALGIDAAAHSGALEANGVTIGVIGSGLDKFYPEENRELARRIAKSGGAVVSQFPFGRPPDRETFPIRNHVVAGLASGVIAVEAPLKSGTLITTGIAADLGRTVMAVPARVDSRMSAGCLQLIRDGAILVRNADDVMEAMSELLPKSSPAAAVGAVPTSSRDPELPPYSVEESMIMFHVDDEGVSVDQLVAKTRLPVAKVNSVVMQLRIKGFLRFLPGNRVAPVRRRR